MNSLDNLAALTDREALAQEAIDNFSALLDGVDFEAEMELMGIGRFQFMRRRQMKVELRGLYMALWRLALQSSFPQDCEEMFRRFLDSYARSHPGRVPAQAIERATQYWGMLQPRGDSDFSFLGGHLASFAAQDDSGARRQALKLALHIRKAYRFIFDRMI